MKQNRWDIVETIIDGYLDGRDKSIFIQMYVVEKRNQLQYSQASALAKKYIPWLKTQKDWSNSVVLMRLLMYSGSIDEAFLLAKSGRIDSCWHSLTFMDFFKIELDEIAKLQVPEQYEAKAIQRILNRMGL